MIETTHPVQAPAWVRHAAWWHAYPIGFLGADPTGASRQGGRTLHDLRPDEQEVGRELQQLHWARRVLRL